MASFPIDNNLAERTIWKLTSQQNNSFYCWSDAGIGMLGPNHYVISAFFSISVIISVRLAK